MALIGLLAACSGDATEVAAASAKPVATATVAAAPMPPKPAAPPHSYVRGIIRSSLEGALVEAVGGDLGPALTQVVKRVLVWWIDPRTDLRKGDVVEVVYEEGASGEEPVVHAVWFESSKMRKTYEAVLFQPEGGAFPRWYAADGEEVEERLVGGPIDEYEQITSLLRDGRRHRGVDFKTPVGTVVKAPFSGTVARVNWSRRANGNCLDLRNGKGMRAYLLHLDSVTVKRGQRVKAGQPVAKSGNTGRSTAPHLHYQLQRGERKIVDPFRFHETRRSSLAADQIEGLRARLAQLARHRPRSQ